MLLSCFARPIGDVAAMSIGCLTLEKRRRRTPTASQGGPLGVELYS